MTNRKKIENFVCKHDLKITNLSYKSCRSSFTYGDSASSGQWSLLLENGESYESCVDHDSVSDAVDHMLHLIEYDIKTDYES